MSFFHLFVFHYLISHHAAKHLLFTTLATAEALQKKSAKAKCRTILV